MSTGGDGGVEAGDVVFELLGPDVGGDGEEAVQG